jgi:hypothetical protein
LSSVEADRTIVEEKRRKLTMDDGIVLPDPDTLIDGWENGPHSYPSFQDEQVEQYFHKS